MFVDKCFDKTEQYIKGKELSHNAFLILQNPHAFLPPQFYSFMIAISHIHQYEENFESIVDLFMAPFCALCGCHLLLLFTIPRYNKEQYQTATIQILGILSKTYSIFDFCTEDEVGTYVLEEAFTRFISTLQPHNCRTLLDIIEKHKTIQMQVTAKDSTDSSLQVYIKTLQKYIDICKNKLVTDSKHYSAKKRRLSCV